MYNVGVTGTTPEKLAAIAAIRERQENERKAVEAERRRMLDEREAIVRAARESDEKIRDQRDAPFNKLTRLLAAKLDPIELGEIALHLQSVDLRRFAYFLADAATAGRAAQARQAQADREAAAKANQAYTLVQHQRDHDKRAEAALLEGL